MSSSDYRLTVRRFWCFHRSAACSYRKRAGRVSSGAMSVVRSTIKMICSQISAGTPDNVLYTPTKINCDHSNIPSLFCRFSQENERLRWLYLPRHTYYLNIYLALFYTFPVSVVTIQDINTVPGSVLVTRVTTTRFPTSSAPSSVIFPVVCTRGFGLPYFVWYVYIKYSVMCSENA